MSNASATSVEIVPASLATLAAEDHGGPAVAALLGVSAPKSWPPEFHGPRTRDWMRRLITSHPDRPGFGRWYVIADGQLVGVCGCKGPPEADGAVEIGYAIVDDKQSKGYASAAVARLLAYVAADPDVRTVDAETSHERLASQRVLLRNGFALVAENYHFSVGPLLKFRRTAR